MNKISIGCSVRARFVVAACGAAIAASAQAQWTAVSLNPAGASSSYSYAAGGSSQGGAAVIAGVTQAYRWSGSAGSAVSLHPAGATESWVNAMEGSSQGGYSIVAGVRSASLWMGTAGSWVNLHPTGAFASAVLDIEGDAQVGTAHFGDTFHYPHASLWHGSAASWVDLNPAGAFESYCVAIDGDVQVGTARYPGPVAVAGLWRGTAASWVQLGSETSFPASPSCMYGDQIGGNGEDEDHNPKSGFWTISTGGWVGLRPGGWSYVQGIGRGKQVGSYVTFSRSHACLWSSSVDSLVDLHPYLPADYANGNSQAWAISFDENGTYISGFAQYRGTSRYDAVVWIGPPTPCFMVTDPVSTAHCPGETGSSQLSVAAVGYRGTLGYQWTHDGVPIDAGQNPSAATAILTVTGPASVGEYRCVITDGCGSVTTEPATVSVCVAEFNCDGFLDFFDYDDFVLAFETGETSADINGDGFLDFFDYDDFVAAFETGC